MAEISLASTPGGLGGQTYSEEDRVQGVVERAPWGGSPSDRVPPRGTVGEAQVRGEACAEDAPGAYCAVAGVVPSLEGAVHRGPGCACVGAGAWVREGGRGRGEGKGEAGACRGGGVLDPSSSDWVGAGWEVGLDGGRVRATLKDGRQGRGNRKGCWVQSGPDGTGFRAWGALGAVAVVPDWAREDEEEEGLTAWGVRNSVSFLRGARNQVRSRVRSRTSTPAPGASWGVCGQIRAAGGQGKGNNRRAIAPSFPSVASEIYPGMVDLRTDEAEVGRQTADTAPSLVSAASGTPFPRGHGCRCSLATRRPSRRPSPARDAPRGRRVPVRVWVETRGPG